MVGDVELQGGLPLTDVVGDVELRGKSWGLPLADGVPVLVFLSGWPDDHDMWTHQIQAFGGSYHIFTMTTPDFDQPALRRRWGYTLIEIVEMLHACIDKALGVHRRFCLVMHDWGCVWGYHLIERLAPAGRVIKIVALDVGAQPPKTGGADVVAPLPPRGPANPGLCSTIWILPYTLWFASVFWVGTRINGGLANCMFRFFAHVLFRPLGPLGCAFSWSQMPRRLADVKWWTCYPYFQVWSNLLRCKALPRSSLPDGIPILFVYGENKRAMFHSGEFVAWLRATPGCGAICYKCSHWVMRELPEQLNGDMRAFL